MHVNGHPQRTIWLAADDSSVVQIIDQRALPHAWVVADLKTYRDGVLAIADMLVRGAPLIGATTAWSLYLAALEDPSEAFLHAAGEDLLHSRPTAVNLRWAVDLMRAAYTPEDTAGLYRALAEKICDDDVDISRRIGEHGAALIEEISERKDGGVVNVLTHCNAGWLATVDWGTATAPIYVARERGIQVHVWVDETRPRNQGAHLTAWELGQEGIPHTVIVDNAGGHLMQHGQVDLCLTGTDRTARSGDVCNKIGTYLKALAARDNDVPFYVALPSTTIDWTLRDGVAEIPIEQRDASEVTHVQGRSRHGVHSVQITPDGSPAGNYAFDVTPARLVTGLITERGVCAASEAGLLTLFPEQA